MLEYTHYEVATEVPVAMTSRDHITEITSGTKSLEVSYIHDRRAFYLLLYVPRAMRWFGYCLLTSRAIFPRR
jgi:hypothetical protein